MRKGCGRSSILLRVLGVERIWLLERLAGVGLLDPAPQRPVGDAQIAGASVIVRPLRTSATALFLNSQPETGMPSKHKFRSGKVDPAGDKMRRHGIEPRKK